MITRKSIQNDLKSIGLQLGDTVLVHSSFKAIGSDSLTPTDVIYAILDCIGKNGTILMPSLSYRQNPPSFHDTNNTPSNIGIIPETFRKIEGVFRSFHPTHSVCGMGPKSKEYLGEHYIDRTPCGSFSPFRKILFTDAKILMLGCGLRPNTTFHAIEEIIGTPYLFGDETVYNIVGNDGKTNTLTYRQHGFLGWQQEYQRVESLLPKDAISTRSIGNARSHLIITKSLFAVALEHLSKNRFTFVSQNNT